MIVVVLCLIQRNCHLYFEAGRILYLPLFEARFCDTDHSNLLLDENNQINQGCLQFYTDHVIERS